MAKLTQLFKRGAQTGAQTGPLAPAVAAEISAAESTLATLETSRGAAVLAAMTEGGDVNALARLEADVVAIRGKLYNLRAAHKVASERDARQRVEAKARDQLDQLSRFKAECAKRDELVTKFCEGARLAAESYRGIREITAYLTAFIPDGCALPNGMNLFNGECLVDGVAFPAPLEHMAAAELYKHAHIGQPGDVGTLPAAAPFSLSTLYRSEALEPWSQSTERMSAYFIDVLRGQIERGRELELAAIDAEAGMEATNAA
jgi:hypothetical protein